MIIPNARKLIQGRTLAEIKPVDTARNACKVMCELDVGAVVVLDGRRLVGVLSERDIIRKVVCRDLHNDQTRVSEIMTPDPRTMTADADLAFALKTMQAGGFHHVPVIDGDEVIGLISADDIPEEYRMMLERFREIRGG